MPIIIDNFQVNTNAPIDNRFVVGPGLFYLTKDDINYKYVGLRVWDSNFDLPFYWDGTQWLSENSVGVLADTNSTFQGEPNYIAKFTSGPTVIGKSLIYENQTNKQLGIGLTGSNINANFSSTSILNGLHVAGNIRTNNQFIGKGRYITDISASNINFGTLDIQYISPAQSPTVSPVVPNTDYVLFNNGSGIVSWRNTTNLSVLNSTNTTNVNVVSETSSLIPHFVTFVQSTGNVPIKVNSSKMQFRPDNGQLFLSDGSANQPTYSFLNINGGINTGMYYDGYNINFSKQSNNFVSIVDNGIAVKSLLYPQISFIETTTNKNRLLWVNNNDNLLFRLDAGNTTTDKRVWHQDNLYTLKNSGNLPIETGRNTNSQSTDANGAIIKGIYTHNVYNTTITPSTQVHWSVISFGKGDEGSVQLASNWYGNNTQNGVVYADRDILLRSLRDTIDSWSPWVKIWNSGNSGYVPFGAIMMWSGSATLLPTGWRLCDGSPAVTIPAGSVPGQPGMTSITIPDLRERFVVGAGVDTSKLMFDYGTNFTLFIPAPVTTPGTYTFNVDITTPYYIDTSGKLKSGVNTDGFRYHLYRGTNTFPSNAGFVYMVYDNRYGSYEVIQGAFPAVNASVTGAVRWLGTNKGGTANLLLTSNNPSFPLNNDTHVRYDKYFTNGRRVAFTEIVWPTIPSTGYNPGDKGGTDIIILEGSQIPKHQHDSMGENGTGPYGTYGLQNNSGARDSDNYRWSTSAYGNSQPFDNRPPYYALAFIIYTGI